MYTFAPLALIYIKNGGSFHQVFYNYHYHDHIGSRNCVYTLYTYYGFYVTDLHGLFDLDYAPYLAGRPCCGQV